MSFPSRPIDSTSSSALHDLHALLIFLCLILVNPVLQAEEPDSSSISETLAGFEKTLTRKRHDLNQLTEMAEKVTAIKGVAKLCVSEQEPNKKKIEDLLASLGKPTKKDLIEVKRQREEVQKKLNEVEQKLANCRIHLLKSDELLKKINDRTKEVLASQLLARGPNIVTLIRDNWNKQSAWISATKDFIKNNSGLDILTTLHWMALLASLIVSIGIGFLIRHYLCNLIRVKKWSNDYTSLFIRAIVATIAYYAPHLLGSTAAATLFYQTTKSLETTPFISMVVIGLPPYFLSIAIIRLLLSPPDPAPLFLSITEKYAHSLSRRLEVLAFLTLLGYLLFVTLISQSTPAPTLLITRTLIATFLIVNILWAISILMQLPRLANMHWLKILIYFSLSAALIIEWMGYRNLSLTLTKDVLGSLLAFGLLLLLSRLFRELYNSLDTGRAGWSKELRKAIGVKPENSFTGILWLRLITTISLWGAFAFILLLVWDVSETILLDIYTYLTQGFNVGSLLIIPQKIAVAIITIAVIITLGGWIRNRMQNTWLKQTRMDRGAKEALVTITGYSIVAIAFLIGLGVSGFDFSSLTIIAGALSVGIGFGLQNVVNNFISGLILLFERPVKTGDWIVVGGTEGYVKSIRIRATQIQTFDSADIIVPNSELIASQVTNWMLHDPRGRARIPVGVAYGSDTEKVRSIMESVAQEHPSVVIDGTVPKPKVLFKSFGDSALELELRCYIQNIDERLHVISDLNFAIDTAFRENGIEIPFPQRDIHIQSGDKDLRNKTRKGEDH